MAYIMEIYGDIFNSSCQTLVNTVNCVGVMSKGIALEFRNKFPEMYETYVKVCKQKQLKPGLLHLWTKSQPWVINFPTKYHWRFPSKMEYIEQGLKKFAETYSKKGITSIAFPELGAGLGGLRWENVKNLMYRYLTPLPNIYVEIYHKRFKSLTLKKWIIDKLNKYKINHFYYISYIDPNVENFIKYGILSRNIVKEWNLDSRSFAPEGVLERRHKKIIRLTDLKSYKVDDLVPLYLTPKTPTFYARRKLQDTMFFAVVQSYILSDDEIDFAFSDGNAASENTKFYYSLNNLDKIPWDVIRSDSWTKFNDGKRKRNSEFLIYPRVPIKRIWKFVVNNIKSKSDIDNIKRRYGVDIEVKVDQSLFF